MAGLGTGAWRVVRISRSGLPVGRGRPLAAWVPRNSTSDDAHKKLRCITPSGKAIFGIRNFLSEWCGQRGSPRGCLDFGRGCLDARAALPPRQPRIASGLPAGLPRRQRGAAPTAARGCLARQRGAVATPVLRSHMPPKAAASAVAEGVKAADYWLAARRARVADARAGWRRRRAPLADTKSNGQTTCTAPCAR